MVTKIVIAVLGVASVVFFMRSRGAFISGTEAQSLVSEGARLIDVRTPGEFESGHIKGAVNIPLDRIGARTRDVGDKGDAVVVYCRSGMRSAQAKRILEQAGFTNVSNLGGLDRWPSAN